MRQLLFAMGWLAIGAMNAVAGTITGTVHASPPAGTPPGAGGSGGDAYESRRYKFVEKVDYDHLHDFVIYIDQPIPGAIEAPPERTVTTTQRDANFDPHVLPVEV